MSILVPWFSREEWMEVHDNAFSNDVVRWKCALDQMSVWKARVSKLPLGVDVSVTLLHTKISESKMETEESIKDVLRSTAVLRFVTVIVKHAQSKYPQTQTLHKLAKEINLPIHLVELRNEIIHGARNDTLAFSVTVKNALETSWQWIKGFYWDPEAEKMNQYGNVLWLRCSPEVEFDSTELDKLLKKYSNWLDPRFVDGSSQQLRENDLRLILRSVGELYEENPVIVTTSVVRYILVPKDAKIRKHLNPTPCIMHQSVFSKLVITIIRPILELLDQLDAITELLCALVKTGTENAKLAKAWADLIMNCILMERNKKSETTDYQLRLQYGTVNWRLVVRKFLEQEVEWAGQIATRLLEHPMTGFTDSICEQVKHLKQIREDSLKLSLMKGITLPPLMSVDDLLWEVSQKSAILGQTAETLREQIFHNEESITSPIGVLQNQKHDPTFYKKLYLEYPDVS